MDDSISRQVAIGLVSYSIELCNKALDSITLGEKDRYAVEVERNSLLKLKDDIKLLSSAQPELLTDDDFETIRIHLNAYKEKLCNQQRWEEAEEYQRIIDRFIAFASAQPRKGKWSKEMIGATPYKYRCSKCNKYSRAMYDFCPNCGADMRGDSDANTN